VEWRVIYYSRMACTHFERREAEVFYYGMIEERKKVLEYGMREERKKIL
tara:strand:+ start:445 stop:591 length:147 start_codon:yes stop_codon:yes gene_type:complete